MTEIQFIARLGLALLLGGAIGLERHWRQRCELGNHRSGIPGRGLKEN